MPNRKFTLPAFPLNVALLPGETYALHIFEPRYRQLVKDCLDNHANFCIPYANKEWGGVTNYGIEVKIIKIIKEYDNGESDILVQAVEPFKINHYEPVLTPKLYGAANGVVEDDENLLSENLVLYKKLSKYMKLLKDRNIVPEHLLKTNIYTIASLVHLKDEEKIELITLRTLAQKEFYLIQKISFSVILVELEKQLEGQFWIN